jgi:hypothetical protein
MKKTFIIDPRLIIVVTSILPIGMLVFGFIYAFVSWRGRTLITEIIVGLIFLTTYILGKNINRIINYICKSLFKSFKLLNTDNYLFFNIEKKDTFNKFKIISDDFGMITITNNKYVIYTLNQIYDIDDFDLYIYDIGKFAKGLQIIFKDHNNEKKEMICQIIYSGTDLKLAGNQLNKSKWAIEHILSWKMGS